MSFKESGTSVTDQQQLEQERRMLEWRLRQQQRQSEEDSRWLAEEEGHLVII